MYPLPPQNRTQKVIASFIVILAVVMVSIGSNLYKSKQKNVTAQNTNAPATTMPSTPQLQTTTPAVPNSSPSNYKDGTFSASSDYNVPSSYENIKVSLTIKNGLITATNITNSQGDNESARWQDRFASAYKSYVVGKSIKDLNLSYVGGASDTTQGFNDALEQIKTQARS
jgi:uncharacterized protein with FMN-binding domain